MCEQPLKSIEVAMPVAYSPILTVSPADTGPALSFLTLRVATLPSLLSIKLP